MNMKIKILVAMRESARRARNFKEMLLPYLNLDMEGISPLDQFPQTALFQLLAESEGDHTVITFEQYQQAMIKICTEALDVGVDIGKITTEDVERETAEITAKMVEEERNESQP